MTMSVDGDSSGSEDFSALIDEELAGISSDSDMFDDDEEELHCSTSVEPVAQSSDLSVHLETCAHPSLIKVMCVKCGRMVDNASAVALGYIHQDLKVDSDELARLRDKDLKSLLGKKKLYLVLDLDHTLLNSTHFHHISPDEEYLKSQIDSLHDLPNGNLFKLDSMRMFTKLRPFVRTFLKEASNMFEMYVYTMGERPYAMEMARLLDPGKIYFDSRDISQADCTQKHQKGLDVVLGAESAVIILDDTEYVWGQHKENLILVDRYHYFASSGRSFNLNNRSLSELKRDESEPDGALATILEVLKLIHHLFFDLERGDDLMRRDVRQVLKTVRSEVLRGCQLVFSRVWKKGELVEKQRLWVVAEELGAICCKELDASVTHIVATDSGTEKSRWAVKHNKFLVLPSWIEAANFLWKRQPEDSFAVNDRLH
ncbi:RNA polymerase II C-terminal domain phosphatase-like 4 isoform X2 [Papaver somniferum]|uniref:RNA polymerase II C-terminal domain phosphatase-like 4 isoform X2 n=1 Tax=Papaver somniferum TaxID=3469 RepID=UPI000E6F6F51|nr:RNA polymerase II C-terminal domain phosphatase-like 4 isoform X2 [Papaver somniferum]